MYHYQHHIGDFNNATRHLTRLERSIYRDLIELYYDTESQLPDDLPWICRRILANDCSTDVERMLNEFFTKTQRGWYHGRCEHEIEKYRSSSSQKSSAGRASAAKRAAKSQQALNGRSTNDEHALNGRSTNRKPITDNHKPITNTNTQPDGCMNAFQEFYDSYPRKIDRVRAEKAFAGINPDPNLLGMMIRHCTTAYLDTEVRYIPSPTTYLNDRRWEDQVGVSGFVGRHTDRSWRDGFVEKHQDRSWADGIDGHVANAEAEIERDHSVVATMVAGAPENAKQGAL